MQPTKRPDTASSHKRSKLIATPKSANHKQTLLSPLRKQKFTHERYEESQETPTVETLSWVQVDREIELRNEDRIRVMEERTKTSCSPKQRLVKACRLTLSGDRVGGPNAEKRCFKLSSRHKIWKPES